MTGHNTFERFIIRFRDKPALFVQEVLGLTPDPWQRELMEAVASGHRRISVRSGHGVGKSSTVSWLMLWYLLTRYPVKVVATAPTSSQLFDALFAECKRWINELPPPLKALLDVKTDRIELKAAPAEAFISARTSRAETPEALQGIHADSVLLIADEASGIPEAVFEAAAGSMSGEHACTILLGNPTRSSGFFFDTHNRLAEQWWTRRVSCVDSPRVSEAYIEEMKHRYGEESNAYRVRVLGEFPLTDDDVLIPYHLIEEATKRDIAVPEHGRVIWACDPARFGSDRTALCKRVGDVVTEIRSWSKADTMSTVGRIKHEYDALLPADRPVEIMVDVIGVGSGVVDRLRELGLPVRGVNVSESPALGTAYSNLRAELWGRMKGWFEARGCRIPDDENLIAELSSVRYAFTSSGKMQIESKEAMKKRGLRSPDLADALVLTFASEAATAMGIRGTAWNKPLKRNLKGVA